MTQKESQELEDAFNMLDKDGSGTLSKDELIEGYRMIYGDNFNEAEVDALINMADENDDGVISYSEWLMTAMNRQKILTNEKLEAAFQGFDVDKSNTVSFQEIQNFLFGTKHINEDLLRDDRELLHLAKCMFKGLSHPPEAVGAGEIVGASEAPLYSTQEPARSGLNTLYKL